jgi:hypothetical protein
LLADWWLVHPAGPAEVASLAARPPGRTVVWLDEIQRYLDGEGGLTGGVIRALLNADEPVVIVGTVWPDRYAVYTGLPAPGAADAYAREREVLHLAEVFRIAPELSPAEEARARQAASNDRRLRVALGVAGYGLTQTLAAAPQLVAQWDDAKTIDVYAWAVLTAALDIARLGARAPLSADLLRAAAVDYCTSRQRAEAAAGWFDQAVAYATRTLHGAAAALTPVGTGMGAVDGYVVADYLLQHTTHIRRAVRVPASLWTAVRDHVTDPADSARLAYSAYGRLLYGIAIPLFQQAADADDRWAADRLAGLLAERGDIDGLRARADAGDDYAAGWLAGLLARHRDIDGLRARADAGDGDAARLLVDLLVGQGDLDMAVQVLRARADAGDRYAARLLTGDLDETIEVMRSRADPDDGDAACQLVHPLPESDDIDDLRAQADAGDGDAAFRLARLLARRGDLDRAVQVLRARADTGDRYAAVWLVDLLAVYGDIDGLRTLADAGDRYAAVRHVDLLAERGDLDQAIDIVRLWADAGDRSAARRLAGLLAKRGDIEGLRARADAGDRDAGGRLVDLLVWQGRGEDAERLRRFGFNPDGSIASGLD